MVIEVGWLCFCRRWRCAVLLSVPAILLLLVGSTDLAKMLVSAAERPYGGTHFSSLPQADAIVVLGGGYYASEHDAYGFAITDAGSRVLTGLELARAGKSKVLILGGSLPIRGSSKTRISDDVQAWVRSWNLTGVVVTNLGICMNTHDEALAFVSLSRAIPKPKILLVSSALHMPRSEALFRKLGVDVTPVACDFRGFGVPRDYGFSLFPKQSRFDMLSRYSHEKVGWAYYRLRGWI
jgi:uncharacterized SAM-binding protein YcdF (DUF218 family)